MRKRGVPCAIVEKWVKTPYGGFRKDCFHFDVLALTNTDTLGLQCGASQHHADKVKKALLHPDVRLWLASPHRGYWVITFSKKVAWKKDGTRKALLQWTPRVTAIRMDGGEIRAMPFKLK